MSNLRTGKNKLYIYDFEQLDYYQLDCILNH